MDSELRQLKKDVKFLEKLLVLKGAPSNKLKQEIEKRLDTARSELGYREINIARYGG